MTEDQIKHMVDRFLGWKLPNNFNPDAGISFKAAFNEEPSGTNLFDATQATEMVRYMAREAAEHGTPWSNVARHMLGLRHGLPGARHWRQVWSDHRLKALPAHEVLALAHAKVS